MATETLHFRVKHMEGCLESLTKDLLRSRSVFRRSERGWAAEKETLVRKLQFAQHYGVLPGGGEGGFFTDQRSILRTSGDLRLQKQVQKLNVSVLCG